MYRLLIVDDNTLLTLQLEEYLSTIGYEVKGIASTGLEAVQMARTIKLDLILMDIKMPGELNGIQAAGIIKSELGIDVVFISGYADEEYLEGAKLIEPLGYIHKPFSEEQIAAALKMACYQIGQKAMRPNAPEELPAEYRNLTMAEMRIAQLLQKGRNTKEICTILKLSPSTVTWHRKNIRKKLGIKDSNNTIQSTLLFNQK